METCKNECENEPGCNAFMTTSGGNECNLRKCPTPIKPPHISPGKQIFTYYIKGNN